MTRTTPDLFIEMIALMWAKRWQSSTQTVGQGQTGPRLKVAADVFVRYPERAYPTRFLAAVRVSASPGFALVQAAKLFNRRRLGRETFCVDRCPKERRNSRSAIWLSRPVPSTGNILCTKRRTPPNPPRHRHLSQPSAKAAAAVFPGRRSGL